MTIYRGSITPGTGATAKGNAIDVLIEDAGGLLTSTNVEDALQEIQGYVNTNTANIATNTSGLAAHLADTTAAHAASAISNTPAGAIAATDVQSAINELDTEKQPLDATLTSLSALGTAADKVAYTTGVDTWAEASAPAYGRGILATSSEAGFKALVNLEAGVDYQAYDATLTALAGTLTAANKIPYATALDTAGELTLDNDTALTADSATNVPTQHAVKTYVDATVTKTLGTPTTLTTQTSVDYTGIPSNITRIIVMFDAVSLNASDNILIQIGDSGGIETTGYVAAQGAFSSTGQSATSSTAGFPVAVPASASEDINGSMTLELMDSTNNTWVIHGGTYRNNAAGATVAVASGTKSLSAVLTQIRITTATGTTQFDAGSVNVSYE